MITIIGLFNGEWNKIVTDLSLKRCLNTLPIEDEPFYAFAENGDRIWSQNQNHYKIISDNAIINFINHKLNYFDVHYDKSEYFINKKHAYQYLLDYLTNKTNDINQQFIDSLIEDKVELKRQKLFVDYIISNLEFNNIEHRCNCEEDIDIINYKIRVIDKILHKIEVKNDLLEG